MAIIEYFLKRLIRKGHLRLIEASGKVIDLGQPATLPRATVRFYDQSMLVKLAQDFSLHFGEAYMDGRLSIQEGTLYDVLEIFATNYSDAPPMPWDCLSRITMPIERMMQFQNSLSSSRKNVAHHYDLSADFFKLFLDSDMQYSCAYFTHPENDIEQAQMDKKRLITSKLLLKEGLSVLDIGCGFGGLAIYMARNFGVNVTGITLSTEQYNIALERVKQEGLEKQIEIRMCDYREEKGTYDRVVSVGMFEHVGVEHYPKFFASIKTLLKNDGIALLHSIGRMDMPGTRDEWLHKYIFPGGYAPALSEVMPSLERSGLWVTDIELLRMHYARTLVCWRESFERNRDAIQKIYDERFCRMWEFFLIGSEMEFRYGRMIVFQMQLAKNINAVPFTRGYMQQQEKRAEQQSDTTHAVATH